MADLKFSSTDGIARVVFDRPAVLNALSPSLLENLIELCAEELDVPGHGLERDRGAQVVDDELVGGRSLASGEPGRTVRRIAVGQVDFEPIECGVLLRALDRLLVEVDRAAAAAGVALSDMRVEAKPHEGGTATR